MSFEIAVINKGAGQYSTEKNNYPMLPGDVFVFSSNELHSITECGKDGLNITNLHFEPRYIKTDSNINNEYSFMNFCFSHSPQFSNRIPSQKAEPIRHYHNMIKSELLSKGDMHSVAVKSYLSLLLVELLRNYNYRSESINDNENHAVDMLAVYDYIEQHFCEDITLAQLADVAHLSPNYFSCIFKQFNGISLWDYITARRVEQAVKLICTDKEKLTMTSVALSCGLNNTLNFNKAFKKHKGITPSQLQKNPKLLSH